MSQTIVIKIGGVASQQLSQEFLNQVKAWKNEGHRLVIVHGGGFAINKLMKEQAIPVKKVNGLRVTSQSDMALVHHALVEQVGLDISKKLLKMDIDSIQLKASLARIVEAEFLDQETLGYVGKVSQIHPTFLDLVLEDDFVPILASLGYTQSGQELNINADYLATAVASALKADRLILMTDVPGVLENKQVLEVLKVADMQEKIDQDIISGGMIPKIQAAVETVLAGVGQVVIGDNLSTGTIIKE